jgi:hypothetical protein
MEARLEMDVTVRIEGSEPPQYLTGTSTGTHNVHVDEGAVVGVYVPVGSVDGEATYRRVDEERKAE